jgi:hypothetical protein
MQNKITHQSDSNDPIALYVHSTKFYISISPIKCNNLKIITKKKGASIETPFH